RVVGDHAADNQRFVACSPEPRFQIRADEGAIRPFDYDWLAGERRRFGLELVAGLAGPVCGTGFERVVAHVIYGQTQAAPGFKQPRNIPLGIGIVARAIAGPACVVYRFLDVNYDEVGRLRNRHVLKVTWLVNYPGGRMASSLATNLPEAALGGPAAQL